MSIVLVLSIDASDLVNRDEAQLGSLLESAVRHNREDDISGMLFYSGSNFLQVLQGTQEQVLKTYQRICRDLRHTNILHTFQQGDALKPCSAELF